MIRVKVEHILYTNHFTTFLHLPFQKPLAYVLDCRELPCSVLHRFMINNEGNGKNLTTHPIHLYL
jgi:hypothetical protein